MGTPVRWSDESQDVMAGDLTVAVSYLTSAGGAVVTSISPLGNVDRERGTLTFTTSLGFGKKLERILRDPHVSLCYHIREHGFATSRTMVLAQGIASVSLRPVPERLRALDPLIVRFLGEQRTGPLWDRLLREYNEERVFVDVAVERLVSWPDPEAVGPMSVSGPAWPDPPSSQARPRNGSGPRVDVAKVARRIARLPHRVVAYRGADGFPVIVPVRVTGHGPDGLRLTAPEGLLPGGGRRAGFLAHRFGPQASPLGILNGTGWLEATGGTAVYAPHTAKAVSTPSSKILQTVLNGLLAKYGIRQARRTGLLDRLERLAAQNTAQNTAAQNAAAQNTAAQNTAAQNTAQDAAGQA